MSEWPGKKATGNARWWYDEALHKHIYHPAHKHIYHPAHKHIFHSAHKHIFHSAQIGELEQLLSSKVAEDERRTEQLQNLQVTACGCVAYRSEMLTAVVHLVG